MLEVLIILGFAVVLLYFWLLGHWFARVLALIVFVPLFALAGAALFTSGVMPPQNPAGLAVLGAIIGSVVAWFTASAPVYYWRHVLAAASR